MSKLFGFFFLFIKISADVFVLLARVAQFFTLREWCHGHKTSDITTSHFMDADRTPPPFPWHSRLWRFASTFGDAEVCLFALLKKKQHNLLVVVFQISCALTIVHFWAHFYHFCYKLVIHTSSLLLHSSVLYRNIILVKVTVHPKVRNICLSSRM